MLRGLLIVLIVGAVAFQVGGVVLDEQANDFKRAALNQASAACDAHLPGGNWSVANETVDLGRLGDVQEFTCTRNGTARNITVDIDIQVET